MKNKKLIIAIMVATVSVFSCSGKKEKKYKYDYKTVEGDFTNTLIYTLDNGLKVYMSLNDESPRIQTNIAVKTGGKNDPSDATGLAHYLEHMLFKGTSKIATLDWGKEKELLKQISDLYEQRRLVTDEEERLSIYRKIDSLSLKASEYAIPNEYDQMMSNLGAKGTNAYTSFEQTVYVNDIPSNELERWMYIESERFNELVLRLFHTELEAVYEEFNRSVDNDYRLSFNAMMRELFKNHTYGKQTVLGKGEHLKNPSMEKIHKYFTEKYVPNNMAIILSGDIDPDKTVNMLKKYFGKMKSKPVSKYTFSPEKPIEEIKTLNVYGTNSDWVDVGFRLPGMKNEDMYMLQVFDGLLANGKAGLIDLNLNQNQKVLNAYSSYLPLKDYAVFYLHAEPKAGQTLEQAKLLLLEQLNKIKSGDFEDWLIPAVVKDIKLQLQKSLSNNSARVGWLTNMFILEKDWSDFVSYTKKLESITKQNMGDFANKYFRENNYVVVNKRTGERDAEKVEKPKITNVKINREVTSDFAQKIENIPSKEITPVFDDYDKSILKSNINNNEIPFYYVKNTDNEIFNLAYYVDIDYRVDKKISLAFSYMKYLGTEEYTPDQLQIELFKRGLEFGVSASENRIYLSLSGLQESFKEGIEIFESIINNIKPDEFVYKDLVARILMERKNNKLDKSVILRDKLANYARYGQEGPLKYQLSKEELMSISPSDLTDLVKQLYNYKHYIYFFGKLPQKEVAEIIETAHKVTDKLNPIPDPIKMTALDQEQSKVYFTHYDMVQAEILMFHKSFMFSKEKLPYIKLFNEYFGSGLASIVFQEIREARALAYSAYSYYSIPKRSNDNTFLNAYVGTQADKLSTATEAITDLMNNVPRIEKNFQNSKHAALKRIETTRTKKRNLFNKYLFSKDMSFDADPQKYVYETVKGMTLEGLSNFFKQQVENKVFTFCVMGDKNQIDKKSLKKLGVYQELDKKTIFGY